MAPSRKYIDNILARLNFPLYTVQMLTNRHVIVGGGGGSSKTGVANGFEIFELAHDGTKFLAEEITRHETGPSVVMNCAAYSDNKHSYLVAGQESHCQLYNVESVLVTEEDVIENIGHNHELKQRKPKAKQKTDNNKNSKRLKFMIMPSDSVQTDFQGKEPLLRVTRIHPTGKILATGGTDGIVRLWKFPTLQPAHVLKAHTKEIDDLDFSVFENYLISIAKDGVAILWDCSKGKQIRKLTWKQPEGSKYLYKRARFGIIEGEDRKSALYILANPTGLAKKQKSYLQQWLPDEGVIKKSAEFDESLAALAVRNDGRFVAVGTMFSGSVIIYIAFSLQRVLNIPGAHSMFVTGLEFLPVSENHTVTSVAEAAVLSISVDNHVCIHTLPYRRTMPALIGILILVLTLFMTFVFCSYIGL
ncbi:prolactin regulatory element-binding protein [Tribolium madens]|uniref:prolactin regulatory element-binding protein n=1 Tax=Tribolium madens TaxID=41895 RepID=UPI001CF747E3|nr:prolactin regulatory element-binding protein [Tribolium madens]